MTRYAKDTRVRAGVVIGALIVITLVVFGSGGGPGGLGGGSDAGTSVPETADRGASFSGPSVTVRNGRPVGGVRRLRARRGERVRFAVRADFADQVTIAGLGRVATVGPDRPAIFSFPGDRRGDFPVQLEGSGIRVARVVVG